MHTAFVRTNNDEADEFKCRRWDMNVRPYYQKWDGCDVKCRN